MNETKARIEKIALVGKWILTIGVALMFIPGMITSFYGIHLSAGVESSLNALGYLGLPAVIMGGLALVITSMKLKKEGAQRADHAVVEPRSGKSLIVWNVLAILLSIPFTFAIIFGGAMASDSGTQSAYMTSYIIMGLGLLYFVGTIICVVISQKKKSLKWTLWPMALPVLLIGFLILANVVGGFYLSRMGL